MNSVNSVKAPKAPEYFNFTADVMEGWARKKPDAPALWCVDEVGAHEEKISFRELSARFRRAANFLLTCGIHPGDRVLVMMPRVPEWWVAMLGLVRLGAVPIPCTTLLTAKDIEYRAETAQAKALITDPDGAAKVEADTGIRDLILVGGERPGWISFDQGMRDAPGEFKGEPTRSDEPGIIYFTSATTGMPKMVLHTQASYGMGHRITGELWLDLKPGDVFWNLSDTGWAKAAWSSFYGPWAMGACVFAVDSRGKFDAGATLKTLAKYPISVWCAPPTALRLIVRENLSAFHFSKLRHCVSAGEPLNPEVIETWRKATGLTIYEGYGQTETVCLIGNFKSRNREVRPGSMGQP